MTQEHKSSTKRSTAVSRFNVGVGRTARFRRPDLGDSAMIRNRVGCAVKMLGFAELTPTYGLTRYQCRIRSTLGNPLKCVSRSGGLTFRRRTASRDPSRFRQSPRTALANSSPSGWAEIVHPFHPLRGQRLEVLKQRRVSGVPTLILRHPTGGTCTVLKEWTDWAAPPPHAALRPTAPLLEANALFDLGELLAALESQQEVDK